MNRLGIGENYRMSTNYTKIEGTVFGSNGMVESHLDEDKETNLQIEGFSPRVASALKKNGRQNVVKHVAEIVSCVRAVGHKGFRRSQRKGTLSW